MSSGRVEDKNKTAQIEAVKSHELKRRKRVEAGVRLRAFIRKHQVGGCRVATDSDCVCALCDADRLGTDYYDPAAVEELIAEADTLRECISYGSTEFDEPEAAALRRLAKAVQAIKGLTDAS